MASTEPKAGEMLKYLPAIYREADASGDQFLPNFLAAFEKILLGREGSQGLKAEENPHSLESGASIAQPSLEMAIAGIAALFDPENTRDDFLPWLAGWAAFTLRRDLTPKSQRKFLSEIFRLYRRRGTKENLEKLLTIFTIGAPTIIEDEAQAHHFEVTLALMEDKGSAILDPQEIERQIAIAYALIDLEKPAHTSYELKAIHVSMQIGVRSTIGKDSLLGVVK